MPSFLLRGLSSLFFHGLLQADQRLGVGGTFDGLEGNAFGLTVGLLQLLPETRDLCGLFLDGLLE